MSRPKFCPNCSTAVDENYNYAVPFSADSYGRERRGWDCYCDGCQWSGDILPDLEDDPVFEDKDA